MDENQRKEILDLLAKGKISIDETVQLLTGEGEGVDMKAEEPIHKADMSGTQEVIEISSIEAEQDANQETSTDLKNDELKPGKRQSKANWLRIKVSNLDNGKNKVSVNIPFGLVEFGFGMANLFAPKNERSQIENFKEIITGAEPGLLVDVQDDESNEHVQIFFD